MTTWTFEPGHTAAEFCARMTFARLSTLSNSLAFHLNPRILCPLEPFGITPAQLKLSA